MSIKESLIDIIKTAYEANSELTKDAVLSMAENFDLSEESRQLLKIAKIMPDSMLRDFIIPELKVTNDEFYHPFDNTYSGTLDSKDESLFLTSFKRITTDTGENAHGNYDFYALKNTNTGEIFVVDFNDAHAENMRDYDNAMAVSRSWEIEGSIKWVESIEEGQAPKELERLKATYETISLEILLKSDHFTLEQLNHLKETDYFSDANDIIASEKALDKAIDFQNQMVISSQSPTLADIGTTIDNPNEPISIAQALDTTTPRSGPAYTA